MRITRLRIQNLRRHLDLDIELAKGLTVIRGPNESGKTTLQRALELALTRRVTSASAELDGLRSWGAGEEDRPWVRLDFEEEDDDGVRSGWVEKAFRGAKGTVALDFGGKTITDPARADEVLAELTGVPSEAFFRSTASVRHHELDGLARDEANLRDRLQASISGGDRGTSRARRKLERAIFELNTRGEKNPGRLKVAAASLGRAAEALREGEAGLTQLERDRDALVGAHDRRAATERTLAEGRSMLEKAGQAGRLTAEQDRARERFDRHRAAAQVFDEIALLEGSHPWPGDRSRLRAIVDVLREAEARLRELRAVLSEDESAPAEPPGLPPRRWRPAAAIGAAAAIGGVALWVSDAMAIVRLPFLGLVIAQPPDRLEVSGAQLVGVVLLAIAAPLLVVARRRRAELRDYLRAEEQRNAELERRIHGRSVIEADMAQYEKARADQLALIDREDLAAGETLVRAEDEHVARIERLRAQLGGLVGGEIPPNLAELRDEAAAEMDQKRAALEAIGPIAHDARAREQLEVSVAEAARDLERARDDEASARARIEQNAVDAEEVAALAERVAATTEQLAALQRRLRVYETTLKAIEAAEKATLRTATRYLEQHMVKDLDQVTGGRYRRVQVNDEDLGIRVFAPERNDWVDVSELSQGTLDIVYLAARIGLVRLVTGLKRPPLILDDPFVTLDDGRATRALELLRSISGDFQVIYLTTSERYDGAAERVVALEPPTGLTAEAVEEPTDGVDAPAVVPGPDAGGAPVTEAPRPAVAAKAGSRD
ncbi:MAG: ATP-binding protein [Chloroflexota bacterium]